MNEESNIEELQHDLRSRNTLRPPSRYALQDQLQIQRERVEDKVKTLKRKHNGKKGLITKKLQIKQLIGERGSWTKLKFFQESLIMFKREAENLHGELMQLLAESDENYGDDWIWTSALMWMNVVVRSINTWFLEEMIPIRHHVKGIYCWGEHSRICSRRNLKLRYIN